MSRAKRRIIVEIDLEGNSTIEVIGGSGRSCKDLTRSLETGLGTVRTVLRLPEYNEAQQVSEKAKVSA